MLVLMVFLHSGVPGDLSREPTRMTSGQISAGLMSNSLRRRSKEDGMVTRSKSRMMRKWSARHIRMCRQLLGHTFAQCQLLISMDIYNSAQTYRLVLNNGGREKTQCCVTRFVLEGLLATAVTIDVRYEYLLTFPIPLPLLVTLF